MRKFPTILLALAAFFLFQSSLFAQCSPQPHPGGTTFAYGVSDTVDPLHPAAQPFVVCDNATLFYYGNSPDTVYLEGSARLYVQECFNLVVYMRNNCQLRCDSIGFTRLFRDVIYDPAFTSFVDTAGSVFQHLGSCPSLSYDYSLFPNGNSPCGVANSVQPQSAPLEMLVYPQPAQAQISVQLPKVYTKQSDLKIYALDGRLMQALQFSGNEFQISLDALPPGNYILEVQNGTHLLRKLIARD